MSLSGKEYQRRTSYDRSGLGGHYPDWSNQPSVYKEYPDPQSFSLPREVPQIREKLSQIIRAGSPENDPSTLSAEQLSQILATAYSITAKSTYPGGEFFYRSVPSAGALYPCELYLATRSVPELENGLYHYSVGRHALVRLRTGNFIAHPPPGSESLKAKAPLLTFFITAIFYRSAWKYRERSYRYHLLDTGHLTENLVLALRSLHLPCEADYDFDDGKVNSLLGLDTSREVCLAVVRVLSDKAPSEELAEKEWEELPEALRNASRVSPKEEAYPILREVHAATSQVEIHYGAAPNMLMNLGPKFSSWSKVPSPGNWPEVTDYAQAVLRRRSLRNFVPRELPKTHFEALLTFLCADEETPGSLDALRKKTVCTGFLAGNVEGIEPGCYWIDRTQQCISLAEPGLRTDRMMHVCLDQEWLTQAALHFFFVTNSELLEQTWGPRGYRYAMLTAGRLGQRIYLGATATGLGCCGIGAFYDNEAAELLGLNESSAMLYLVAVGPVKKVFRGLEKQK